MRLHQTLIKASRTRFEREARAAAGGFVARAAKSANLDVAYTVLDSPVGDLLVAATAKGLVRVALTGDWEAEVEYLASALSPRVMEAPSRLDGIRRELDQYFVGSRKTFGIPIDRSLMKGFQLKVLNATARIPYGSLATYKDVATRAGNPRASRAAGGALGANPIPIIVPCHRVVRTGGDLGGYGGGLWRKRLLLELEGAI